MYIIIYMCVSYRSYTSHLYINLRNASKLMSVWHKQRVQRQARPGISVTPIVPPVPPRGLPMGVAMVDGFPDAKHV